jgi:hypothetical protein
VFLLVQIVLLIDFCYDVAEWFHRRIPLPLYIYVTLCAGSETTASRKTMRAKSPSSRAGRFSW